MKSFKNLILENSALRIKDIAKVGINMKDADFWLQRKGSEKTIGTPSKSFNKEDIGIKVVRTDVIYPDFLYYYMQHLLLSGYWRKVQRGMINLVNITVKDVNDAKIEVRG